MMKEFSLEGKTALITGGYGHLGRSMTMGLLEAGSIVIVGGRDEVKFKKAFNENKCKNLYFTIMDVSSTDSIRKSFRKIKKQHGRLDILVNNAVYVKGNSAEKISDEEWAYSIDGSLSSVFRCIREVIPLMKERGGKIINVSSMYGMIAPDFRIYSKNSAYLNPPHYGAAKSGIIQLTKYYAVCLARYNIRVNCISPGPFPSDAVRQNRQFINKLSEKVPLRRVGNRQELKGPVVFLASDASSYVTGQNIVVDGGWMIW